MYDVIVIGAGPAGATSSIYLKRANLDVLVFENNKTSLEKAKIENYYGYLSLDGKTLYESGIDQLSKLNIPIIHDEIIKLEYANGVINAYTLDECFQAKYLILGAGLPLKLDSRFDKLLGLGISLCAHCDGPFYKNKRINVTGYEPYLSKLIQELKVYSSDINIIDINKIKELKGKMYLEEVTYDDEKIESIDNLFLALPLTTKKLLFEFGLVSDNKGYIKVDNNFETNIKNVYAIGDSVDMIHQVVSASYSGMVSSLNIIGKHKNENN